MEQNHNKPQPLATPVLSKVETQSSEGQRLPTIPVLRKGEGRHDGWTGEKMATFCETLAETAVVADACDAARMGVSGAYAARRRNPVFAAAWDAALSIARERLADTLLARSMEGNVEQIYKDGELVGERHVIDNRLGLAILRRLDRLAETGLALHSNPPAARAERSRSASPAILPKSQEFDWERMVGALRGDDLDEVARALALVKSHEVEEVEDPSNRPPSAEDEDEALDLTDRCWRDEIDEIWMTDFPPPEGFTGWESRPYDDMDDDEPYKRTCTDEEAAILEADAAAERAAKRVDEEDLRDRWFALLREQLTRHPDDEINQSDGLTRGRGERMLPSARGVEGGASNETAFAADRFDLGDRNDGAGRR